MPRRHIREWKQSLTSTLDADWGPASRPFHFTPRRRAPVPTEYRRLGGPQSRPGNFRIDMNLSFLLPFFSHPARSLATTTTTPFWLFIPNAHTFFKDNQTKQWKDNPELFTLRFHYIFVTSKNDCKKAVHINEIHVLFWHIVSTTSCF